MNKLFFRGASSAVLVIGCAASAQELPPTYSLYGTPGLLEMPSALTPEEGALAATFAYREGLFQTALNFQLTERFSGAVRYAIVDLVDGTGAGTKEAEFERGFDLQFKLVKESDLVPAVAVGLRDFLTPGRFQSEYIVASKSIADSFTLTAGLGWGAMGTRDGFDNLIGDRADRPVFDEAEPEGQLASDFWFAGDAALFGGLEYQINDRWGVLAEYSSIAYPDVPNSPDVGANSPYSFGVTFRPREGMQFSVSALNGETLGLSGSFYLNANNRPAMSGLEPAPIPVKARNAGERAATGWDRATLPEPALREALATTFDAEGITLHSLALTDTTARARVTNRRYRSDAQGIGRMVRLMTQVLPPSIETFIIEPQARGVGLSAVRIARSDIEQLENRPGAADAIFQRSDFTAAGDNAGLVPVNAEPSRFAWGLTPYFRIDPFGNGGAVSVDGGVSLSASYRITPQLVLSGAILQSLFRNDAEDPELDSTPDLQNVRSDGGFYGDDGVPVLQSLQLSHYGRLTDDLYSRVSAGYLERMFGGVSTEVLWKPVESRLGLGAELNYVAQRDTDMGFGFDEYDYEVATGHVSAYYDIGGGYHAQIDVGRYLAGDWGATLRLDREYANGVRVGAYVSQTDVSYEDFGNGSYNKGIVVRVPTDFLTGQATRSSYGTTFRTRIGDGGAQLSVSERLYEMVRDGHQADLEDTWGRFWR